ncbi:MAG: hypothetical protein ACP5OO_11210 [Chloroflexia bacterium]
MKYRSPCPRCGRRGQGTTVHYCTGDSRCWCRGSGCDVQKVVRFDCRRCGTTWYVDFRRDGRTVVRCPAVAAGGEVVCR